LALAYDVLFRSIRMRRWIFALTPVILASTTPSAADVVGEFQSRPTAIYGQVGLGTPLGFAGVEVEHLVTPEYAVSVGTGYGTGGPQLAAMVRLLAGGDRSKFTLGAGVSGGGYTWEDYGSFPDDEGLPRKSGTVAWGNLEIGGEHRFRNGFAVKYFGGYGHVILGNLVCESGARYDVCVMFHHDDGYNLLYTGGAIGYAF
jgi:hypothetical protein